MKYKHHDEGSNKGLVHFLFDVYGAETAIKLGRRLTKEDGSRLDPETPGQWISDWKRGDEASRKLEKREVKLEEVS